MCKNNILKKNLSIKLTKKNYIYIKKKKKLKSGGSFEPPEQSIAPPLNQIKIITYTGHARQHSTQIIIVYYSILVFVTQIIFHFFQVLLNRTSFEAHAKTRAS